MLVLGLDVGIASVGWGLVDDKVIAAGSWIHDPPEDKTQSGTKLRSEARRMFRGQRRVIRRRRLRMNQVRGLFAEHGLLPSADRDALRAPDHEPWELRVAGLKRVLSPQELAVALGHIARHRGFKSNARARGKNAEDGTMLKENAQTREKVGLHGTPARALGEDEHFVLRRTKRRDGGEDAVRRFRNRDGHYFRTLMRDDLEAEVRAIFREQRRLQAPTASAALEQAFVDIAFFQRPLQDSEHMVGPCPFEPAEKRAAKRGLSFERFRLLSRLNNLRLQGRDNPRLTKEEIGKATADLGATAKISFSALRKKLGLSAGVTFEGTKPDEEGKRDVVARSGEAMAGTARLRKLIAEHHGEMAWHHLLAHPDLLDRAAEMLSFRADIKSVAAGLAGIGLDPDICDTLIDAAEEGDLDIFVGAGHISAKAARAIVPGLVEGETYDEACKDVGYDHTASRERHAFDVGATGKQALALMLKQERISRELIGSPTARKALIESLKQVKAIFEYCEERKLGTPERIHIELARDVGKSIEERDEIERGIERRNKQREKLRALFADQVGRPPQEGSRGGDEMLRFELWEQQQGRCLFSGEYISPAQLVADDNSVQVDHILPWSRFGDDSFHNRTLCFAKANQEKRARTPFEWLGPQGAAWDEYVARIKAIPYMKGMKRRNYLLQNAEEVAERFRTRNLNDTRWSCRLLGEALRQVLPDERDEKGDLRRRVFARPGALTDRMRRAWGLQRFKKDIKLRRILDDRHHAIDGLIVAATTESLLNRATREVQQIERDGLHYDLTKNIDPPWPGFREQVIALLPSITVARAERRRARGKAHDATIRRIGEVDGREIVYERRRVEDLKKPDLRRIKGRETNPVIVANLAAWIAAGRPADKPPLSPKGDPIGKVRLESKGKVAVRLWRGGPDNPPGAVDRGEMARVDVFAKATPKGVLQYFLVPIYPHEIATLARPPLRAVTAYKPEDEWPVMDETYQFMWSLVPMTLLKVVDRNGTVFFPDQTDGNLGYFRGFNRANGSIDLSSLANGSEMRTAIGARTLSLLQKMTVDRLGRTFDVGRETRTWHGKACI